MTHAPLCPRQPYEQVITSVFYIKGTEPDLSKIGKTVTMWTADEDACCCEFIANVREDERGRASKTVKKSRILPSASASMKTPLADRIIERDRAYRDGQRDMLAKCIEAVESLPPTTNVPVAHPHEGCPDPTIHMRWTPVVAVPDILTALRALKEEQ